MYTEQQRGQVTKMTSILIKLLLDMWLAADARATFSLCLAMLVATFDEDDPTFRIRAFDLLYNLSLHAHMIEPHDPTTSEAAIPKEGRGSKAAGAKAAAGYERQVAPRIVSFAAADSHGGAPQPYLPAAAQVCAFCVLCRFANLVCF